MPELVDAAIVRMRKGMTLAKDAKSFIEMYVDALDGIQVGEHRVSLDSDQRSAMTRAIMDESTFK